MALTTDQVAFFESFGYLQLPGYMADELEWIEKEHARLFVELGVEPDGERTVDIIPFIAQSEMFMRLRTPEPPCGAAQAFGYTHPYPASLGRLIRRVWATKTALSMFRGLFDHACAIAR